jgi:hypothetical protein
LVSSLVGCFCSISFVYFSECPIFIFFKVGHRLFQHC